MTHRAFGRVLVDGKDSGSAFAISDGRALTAGHVVRLATRGAAARPPDPAVVCVLDHGPPYSVQTLVAYRPEGAEPIPVTRIEVSTDLDVALLHLHEPAPAVLPVGPLTPGAHWRVETRPRPSDPALTGTVTDPHRRLRNQRGDETTLVQLWVREELGDYQGYSGSPVTSSPKAATPGWVIGVLVEQARWRTSPQPGQPVPVANVLFAAPIEQVLTEFGVTGATVGEPIEQIPLPVPFEVRRPDQLNRVIDALLADLAEPVSDGRLVGLVGMGGSGKSVLAAAAARDPRVRDAFPDGQLWLELGPDPPLLQLQARLAAALGDSTPITDMPQGRARLSRLLAERRCLLVLDNVWASTDLSAFAVAGPAGRMLVTTRDAAALPADTGVLLDDLASAAALQVLAGWTATPAGQLPAEAALVVEECGHLPLALALCGAMVATGGYGWPELLDLLRRADLEALHSRLIDYPHRSLAVALGASLGTLPPAACDRYLRLAVFSAEGPVPEAALQQLWGLGEPDTAALVNDLAAKSLLRVAANRVSLHDLQMDYLVRSAATGLPALHDQLLAAYREQCDGGWATGPDDGYFRQHLARHLSHANRIGELRALLLDLDWMTVKLTAGDVSGLLTDYAALPSDPALSLVAGALRLSAHVLADDPGQLPSQLTARLTDQADPQLNDLLQRVLSWSATPWLRPLTASLTPPGGPLVRILAGHDRAVTAVALSADGRRVVSGGRDGSVRAWDLEEGVAVHVLPGHPGRASFADPSGGLVYAVAVSADGRRAVSGGHDGMLRVWDLESGAAVHALPVGRGSARSVAVSADGRRAASGRDDGTVQVWDLEEGAEVHVLPGHDSRVRAVAISADGRRAVSGDENATVRVWDLEQGTADVLTGHEVYAVAFTAAGLDAASDDASIRVWDLGKSSAIHVLANDGNRVRAVEISADRRALAGPDAVLRAWDLTEGSAMHALAGYAGAVAVSADGHRAVSGGDGGTLQVWDLEAGAALHAPAGYHQAVRAMAISATDRPAVSGPRDGTVQVWDLDPVAALGDMIEPDDLVYGAAVSADGRRAVSGSGDGTVRVWDLDSGAAAHILPGHDGWVSAVAVSADGHRAVSGGHDGTVRVWDLDSGASVHVMVGHRAEVTAVAISADGRRAASGGDDTTVRVWDLATGKAIVPPSQRIRHRFAPTQFSFRGFRRRIDSLSISADGRRAVSLDYSYTVRVWDLNSGAALHTLAGDHSSVAISADGRRVVSGSYDGTVRVWDVASGAAVRALVGRGTVRPVAVSADGRHAVSSSGRTLRLWNLTTGAEIASFVSDSDLIALGVTPPGVRVIAVASGGAVHLLELRAYT